MITHWHPNDSEVLVTHRLVEVTAREAMVGIMATMAKIVTTTIRWAPAGRGRCQSQATSRLLRERNATHPTWWVWGNIYSTRGWPHANRLENIDDVFLVYAGILEGLSLLDIVIPLIGQINAIGRPKMKYLFYIYLDIGLAVAYFVYIGFVATSGSFDDPNDKILVEAIVLCLLAADFFSSTWFVEKLAKD